MRRLLSVALLCALLTLEASFAHAALHALPPHAAGAVKRLVSIGEPLEDEALGAVQLSATIEREEIALVGRDPSGRVVIALTLRHPSSASPGVKVVGGVAIDRSPGPTPRTLLEALVSRIGASGVALPWVEIERAPESEDLAPQRVRHDWTEIDRDLGGGFMKRARLALSATQVPEDVMGCAEYALRWRLAGDPSQASRAVEGREAERAPHEIVALRLARGDTVRRDEALAALPLKGACEAAALIGLFCLAGEGDTAARVADLLLERAPSCGEALYHAVRVNVASGRFSRAEELLARGAVEGPPEVDVLRAREYLFAERGELSAAHSVKVRLTMRRALTRGVHGALRMAMQWVMSRVEGQVSWWTTPSAWGEGAAAERAEAGGSRWCPEHGGLPCLIRIDGGAFVMGAQSREKASPGYDPDASSDEGPVRRIELSPLFAMEAEVDARSYAQCVKAGGCRITDVETQGGYFNYGQPLRGDHPINGVSWEGARRYCAWLGGRLPTEAEWEYLARGPEGRRFAWGDTLAQCDALGSQVVHQGCPVDGTRGPGILKTPSAMGLSAMGSGVWEWVSDYYAPYAAEPLSDPRGPTDGKERVQRGGAFSTEDTLERRAAFRASMPPESRVSDVGFRCVRSRLP